MPKTSRRLAVLAPFLAAALACNALSGGPAAPTAAQPTAAPTGAALAPTGALGPGVLPANTAEPSPTPEPQPPLSSLMANLRARVKAGQWTEEQGLTTTLKFVAGQAAPADLVMPGATITSYEAAPIVRAAAAYVQNGQDEATKAELQKLLTLIFPDPAVLDKFSAPAPAAGSGKPAEARPRAQTAAVDCASLWSDGFPAGTSATCFQTRTETISGQTYRLYVPTSLPAGDGRAGLADAFMQAVRDSVAKYTSFGPMPSADLVITLLPDTGEHGEDTDAAAWMGAEGGHCLVALFPRLGGMDPAVVKQIVAHELFHCYQYRNYFNQTGVAEGIGDWWIEGTAEFFSNVVYPTVNAEYQYVPDFDGWSPADSLVEMDYGNFIFYQYMENHGGDNSVLGLMSRMPNGGGRAEQLQALAAVPGIRDLFRDFAKAYIDRSIQDTGGGNVPVSPLSGPIAVLDRSGSVDKPVRDFVIERMLLRFPAHTRHNLHQVGGGVDISTRPRGGGDWGPLPESLQGCGERQMIWLATTANGDGGTLDTQIQVQVEDARAECDTCLVGRWQLNNMSLWNTFETFIAGTAAGLRPTLQSFDGQAFVTFAADGTGTTDHNNLHIHYTQDIRGDRADANIGINGQGAFLWSTTDNATLNVDQVLSEPTYDNSLTLTKNGRTIALPVALPHFQTPASGPYQCTASTLVLDSPGVHGSIQFDKVSP